MLSFYSVKLSSFQMQIFNTVSRELAIKEYPTSIPFDFTNLSLNELGCYAKTNQLALEEFLKRIGPRINTTVKKFCEEYKLKKHKDLCQYGLFSSVSIINSYDSTKGPFINFYISSLKRALYFKILKFIRDKENSSMLAGSNKELDLDYLSRHYQIQDPDPIKIANYVDVYKYLSKQSKLDKNMTILYLKGYTLSEIAKFSNYSIGTISLRIRKVLSRISHLIKGCDYKYLCRRL